MTDAYAVTCPNCLAEPGEHCTNHIRPLDKVHWSRQRVARQRRSRLVSATAATATVALGVRGGRGRSG
jgi:hypothetical protein